MSLAEVELDLAHRELIAGQRRDRLGDVELDDTDAAAVLDLVLLAVRDVVDSKVVRLAGVEHEVDDADPLAICETLGGTVPELDPLEVEWLVEGHDDRGLRVLT